jgi:hypothetical protein
MRHGFSIKEVISHKLTYKGCLVSYGGLFTIDRIKHQKLVNPSIACQSRCISSSIDYLDVELICTMCSKTTYYLELDRDDMDSYRGNYMYSKQGNQYLIKYHDDPNFYLSFCSKQCVQLYEMSPLTVDDNIKKALKFYVPKK